MSHWSEVKTAIQEPELFLEICDKHGLKITNRTDSRYKLTLEDGSGSARFEQKSDGSWLLSYDQDRNYSQFAAKIGVNGGTLMRDYATEMTQRQAYNMGMPVMSQEVMSDGSIRIVLAG